MFIPGHFICQHTVIFGKLKGEKAKTVQCCTFEGPCCGSVVVDRLMIVVPIVGFVVRYFISVLFLQSS